MNSQRIDRLSELRELRGKLAKLEETFIQEPTASVRVIAEVLHRLLDLVTDAEQQAIAETAVLDQP